MPDLRAYDHIRWQVAGLTDTDGQIDRPVPSMELVILPTKIVDDDLVWSTGWAQAKFRRPGKGMLGDFLNLVDAKPARVLRFVQTWGVLDFHSAFQKVLRAHGQSTSMKHTRYFAGPWIGPVLQARHTKNCDPIAAYHAFSNHVRGILRLVTEIYDSSIKGVEWELRYPYHCETCSYGKAAGISEVKLKVAWLLRLGGVIFDLDWDESNQRFHSTVGYQRSHTLGALAMQVMLAVSRVDSLYICSGCGKVYERTYTHRRRPKPDQSNYCPTCGSSGKAVLDAKARYRRKIREARRLHAAGIPIKTIAEELGMDDHDIERIKTWVAETREK